MNSLLFTSWKEGKGHTKMEDVVISWIHSLALQKRCPFPNSLFTAKKPQSEVIHIFPISEKVHN